MEHNFMIIAEKQQLAGPMALFNRCRAEGEILYNAFETLDAFNAFFLNRQDGVKTVCISNGEDGCFACGCLNEEKTKGYITFIGVRKDLRRRGLGRELLHTLEAELQNLAGKQLDCIEATFFNPMNFVWTVPGTQGHEHPNAPGVDVAGSGYLFLKNCGYRDYAIQNAYHLNLQGYELTPAMAKKKAELKEKGIEITVYDPNKHTGLEDLLLNLNNELWHREIMATAADPKGAPILIVDWNGRAMGFTGPMRVQENGRGYLAGVGVHSECRGLGAGKLMFGELCVRLKELGAGYMTLFTGENNPARNIYEAQGFKIVRTWADMRKQTR